MTEFECWFDGEPDGTRDTSRQWDASMAAEHFASAYGALTPGNKIRVCVRSVVRPDAPVQRFDVQCRVEIFSEPVDGEGDAS